MFGVEALGWYIGMGEEDTYLQISRDNCIEGTFSWDILGAETCWGVEIQ